MKGFIECGNIICCPVRDFLGQGKPSYGNLFFLNKGFWGDTALSDKIKIFMSLETEDIPQADREFNASEPPGEKGAGYTRTEYYKDLIRTHWRQIDNMVLGLFTDTALTSTGKEISERSDLIHPSGLDELERQLRDIREREPEAQILIASNHPDFQDDHIQNPLWYLEVFSRVGKLANRDANTFVTDKLFPKSIRGLESRLFVVAKKRPDPLKNYDILHESMEQFRKGEPEVFFIFPEGVNAPGDVMVEAKGAGVSTFVDAARKFQKPLVILPIALEQKLASRGEASVDEYSVKVGKPLRADDFPQPVDGDQPHNTHKKYANVAMRKISEMLPPEKRGYYSNAA